MIRERRNGRPLAVIGHKTGLECRLLHKETKIGSGEDATLYDEEWIQKLIANHPEIIPMDQIEPALTPIIHACMELTTASGSVDNLFITPNGDIIIVECKLWKNPQARREVVAQIIDYAKDLSKWSYEDMDASYRASTKDKDHGLYDLISKISELDEPRFVDAINRNLRRGRFLLLIVGDGISENAEKLVEYLQQNTGIQFTLALIQLAVYRLDEATLIVLPSIPVRTMNINRVVVEINGGSYSFMEPAKNLAELKPVTMSEEIFYEKLGATHAGASELVKQFIDRVTAIGVVCEIRKVFNIKWIAPSSNVYSFGWIWPDSFDFDYSSSRQYFEQLGQVNYSDVYAEALVKIIPMSYTEVVKGRRILKTKAGGKVRNIKVWEFLNDIDGVVRAINAIIIELIKMEGEAP